MAQFEYTARSADGKQTAGVIQAENEAAVIRALDDRALFPLRIAERSSAGGGRGRKVKLRQLGLMYGQLGDLLSAGVPLLRSLEILIRMIRNAPLRSALAEVREAVSEGESLAEAMGRFPETFRPLHTAMIRAGERAGFLEEVLENLANFTERQDELRSKVRAALIYPMVLVTVGTLAISGILVTMVPKFKDIFAGQSLPMPTRIVFGASDFLVLYWPLAIVSAAVIVVSVRGLLRSRAGQETWERWRLRIPVAGRVVRMVSVTRFSRILGTMLKNGVPILQALSISKDATGSALMAASIDEATDAVRAGDSLAEPLRDSGLIPEEVIEMIAVGEESNQLEKVLLEVADRIEKRTAVQVDVAVRLIEPLILILLAIVLTVVAVGLMYPIFTMGQQLTS